MNIHFLLFEKIRNFDTECILVFIIVSSSLLTETYLGQGLQTSIHHQPKSWEGANINLLGFGPVQNFRTLGQFVPN
jgi:hypothetical protein